MVGKPNEVRIYHITDIENLQKIVQAGGLLSDNLVTNSAHAVIGYDHIKHRRLTEIQIACCGGAYVGQFVPFYFCPRSPMLFTINRGNTGRPEGCQRTIVHLVSTFNFAVAIGKRWAVSDGNAGTFHAQFFSDANALDGLDWEAINATDWRGRQHQKASEFLIEDSFPWEGIKGIGCFDQNAEQLVRNALRGAAHVPAIAVKRNWYY